MMRLTRRYRFSASHRLHSPGLSAEENAEAYGKCNNPRGHGHDYVLEVSVRGPLDPRSARVVNVPELDRLVEREVLSRLRHRDLNSEAPELAGAPTTTENLAIAIRANLARYWKQVFPGGLPALERIRIHETRRNVFETAEVT
jgi:6-pyruvoyltetrahydropterin/6-carboxytetrahydropterin synthase